MNNSLVVVPSQVGANNNFGSPQLNKTEGESGGALIDLEYLGKLSASQKEMTYIVNSSQFISTSNHSSHVPVLSKDQKENMLESVVRERVVKDSWEEELEEGGLFYEDIPEENKLETESIVSIPFSVKDEESESVSGYSAKDEESEIEQILIKAKKTSQPKVPKKASQPEAPKKVRRGKKEKMMRRINKQKEVKEEAEQKVKREDQFRLDQKRQAETNSLKGFKLFPIQSENSKDTLLDTTGLSENFYGLTPNDMGYRHMQKRLSFFKEMSRYIQSKAHFLKDNHFPQYEKKQFKATAYVVPSQTAGRSRTDFERAHVSILNKIVVKDRDNQLYKMEGALETADRVNTTVQEFFNICDIAPKAINSIDWYAEYHLRQYAYELLQGVKIGDITSTQAANIFAGEYNKCLNGLQKMIKIGRIPNYMSVKMKKEMAKILADKNSSEYVNGMLGASFKG